MTHPWIVLIDIICSDDAVYHNPNGDTGVLL